MPHTLFLSWQSDTPARIGSEFIEEALGLAVATLGEDAEIKRAIRDEGLMVDRDTQGVPGVPPIVDTIFDKIDSVSGLAIMREGRRRDLEAAAHAMFMEDFEGRVLPFDMEAAAASR
jgi:hypothetical protein